MKNRRIGNSIVEAADSKTGRIIVLTGARQTGKTTLVKKFFKDYSYISLDDPVLRQSYAKLSAEQIFSLYPKAIFDEVQKLNSLIESVKAVYDQYSGSKYILTGSSQLLLLEKVRESLAGRCRIFELFPLTLPEIRTISWDSPVNSSLLVDIILDNKTDILPSSNLDKNIISKNEALDHCINYGSYPAVTNQDMDADEKFYWLQNYVRTYLERDIRDLANFRDLEPFVILQRYLAQNTACLINASDLSRRIGISVKTVQKYLRYFEISYQILRLPAWYANFNKRLSKMSKLHILDNGVLQAVLQKPGKITGQEFESLIVSEIYKQIKNWNIAAKPYHLRTHDGKEVDLLLEMNDRYYAFEIKLTDKTTRKDIRHLSDLESVLDKPLEKAFLISMDTETTYYSDNIIAVNAAMFLG